MSLLEKDAGSKLMLHSDISIAVMVLRAGFLFIKGVNDSLQINSLIGKGECGRRMHSCKVVLWTK